MYVRKVTTTGQQPCVTIPKDLRHIVDMEPGDKVEIKPLNDGSGFAVKKVDRE